MSFQATIQRYSGQGVVGDLYTDNPRIATSYILNSALASYNVFGRAFTIVSEGIAQAGGTGVFAGILSNPKTSASFGSASSPLDPTLTLPNESQGEILSEGSMIVSLPAPAAIGDLVVYNTTTGVLSTIAPNAALPVGAAFAYATVSYKTVTAAGLAIITLQPTLTIPT